MSVTSYDDFPSAGTIPQVQHDISQNCIVVQNVCASILFTHFICCFIVLLYK